MRLFVALAALCALIQGAAAESQDCNAIADPALRLTCYDKINPPATVRHVAHRYSGRVAYEELPGMSHWLVGEPGWDAVAARALEWLAVTRQTESA